MFGRINPETGFRQYKTCYIEIPKKNGKTELAAAVSLLLLVADDELGAEVYYAAADKEQASLCFNVAAQMVRTNEFLKDSLTIIDSQKRIIDHERAGLCRVLSAEAYSKHGLNASGIIFDELHAQPNRELWDVLTLGSGAARTQQLIFTITTAGYDRQSICFEQHDYAQTIINGVIDDPTFFPIIYGVGDDEDWEKEKTWKKSNPSLGQIITLDGMRAEYLKAKETPAMQNTFRRLRLNQWTQQANRWIDITLWNQVSEFEINEDSLLQKECYGGLDLSSVNDLTAWVMLFPDENDLELVRVIARFWCPEFKIYDSKNRYRDHYQLWAKEGWLFVTKGEAVDYQFVKKEIMFDSQRFRLIDMNVDRLFQGHQIAMELQDEGLEITPMGMGFRDFAAPMKEFHRRLIQNKILHGNNPVLNFMIDNLAVIEDANGNLKPDKASSQGKIDGIVSLVMALDRCMRHENKKSIYETRGVVCL